MGKCLALSGTSAANTRVTHHTTLSTHCDTHAIYKHIGMAPMRILAASAAAAAVAAPLASGFYLPGVAPTNFVEGQRVELKVSSDSAYKWKRGRDYVMWVV